MKFHLNKSIEILEQTPKVLEQMLRGLSQEWRDATEGENTWNAFDIVGHLIHGEKTDWIPRMEIILSEKTDKRFTPFDRFAQMEISKSKTLEELLEEFSRLRSINIEKLRTAKITDEMLSRTGIHPEFGEVNLRQLLSTWVVHDLDHLSQVVRVFAKQYAEEVGPWKEYLKIVR